jgi:hypothetical protein
MTLQEILASLLNPGGSQQAQPMPPQMGGQQIGDHSSAALPFQQPPQMQQQPPQGAPQQPMPQQAPQGQPMAQDATQAPQQAPTGGLGGLGGILQSIIAPQSAQKNKTVGWLTSQGLDPGTATVLASDKTALRSYILQKSKGGGMTAFDERAQAAQQYGLDPTSPDGRDFILTGNLPQARGGNAELGLNPQYGVDDQGNPALLQLGKDGKVVKSEMPAGVTLSKTPIKLDAGTQWILLDPITRQPVGQIPKDLAGAASQTAQGAAQGAAAFDLPRVEQNANTTLSVLERMKTHPGREGSTGFIQGMLPARTSDQLDFQSLVDQTKGQSFLQAFQMLKGAGAITDIEGAKATDAISRLGNQRLSDQDYLGAINDLETVIKTGLTRAQQQAGGQQGYTPGAPAATTPGGQRVIQQMTNPQPMGDGWQNLGNGVRVRKVN